MPSNCGQTPKDFHELVSDKQKATPRRSGSRQIRNAGKHKDPFTTHLMATTSFSLVSNEHLSDWTDPLNLDWVAGPFKLPNIDPRLPVDGADLRYVMPHEDAQGRSESWEGVRQRAESYARCEFGYDDPHPYMSITEESRLMVGTLALPEMLLRGTYKSLFGETTEFVTTWQVRAVAFALFNPDLNFWGSESWESVCRRAEAYAKRRERITAQVQQLLSMGA
jgi:hypothetical protein